MGDGEFNNGFFNDALPFDFGSPLNFNDVKSPRPTNVEAPASTATPASVKAAYADKSAACANLLSQIQKNSDGVDDDYGLNVDASGTVNPQVMNNGAGAMLNANTIWNQLQANKDFQDGKFDLDGLCSELRSKAKCSESGVAVPADLVDRAFKKLSGEIVDERNHPIIFEETQVDDAVQRLGGDKINWGGFGMFSDSNGRGW